MSTHNIGFYEDLTKIIFELSSNIIKYAPYFLCCTMFLKLMQLAQLVGCPALHLRVCSFNSWVNWAR